MSIESYKWLMKSIEYPLKVKCLKFVSVAQLVEQSTLLEQYKKYTFYLKKWCKKEGLPYKKAEINIFTEEEWKEI